MKKTIKIIFIVGILLLASMQTLFALGITPGRTTIIYPGDASRVYSFTILNSEAKNINLSIQTSGELANAISLNQNNCLLKSNEDSKTLSYTFKLPENLSPGQHKGVITVVETGGEDDSFGAKLGVSTEIVVFIPYPSKYIESDLDVFSNTDNNLTTFLIPLINHGTEKIENASATIDIYQKETKIATITTNSISLDSMTRGEVSADWKANDSLGRYHANVILIYDNETTSFSKDFQVGEISLDVFDLFIEDFELGSIVKMDILVVNKWNDNLKEVYANLILSNETGKIVDISSAPINIDALSQIRIPLYWDTSGISEGKYNGKIIINYKEFSKERKLYVEISKYGIGFELESGEFVFEQKSNLLNAILLALLIFGVIVVVIYLIFIQKNNILHRQKAYK